MNRKQSDELAFAIMQTVLWAVRGGKPQEIAPTHEQLSDALLDFAPFNKDASPESDASDASNVLDEGRARLLDSALDKTGGNVMEAARNLGVSRWTVYRHVKGRERGN